MRAHTGRVRVSRRTGGRLPGAGTMYLEFTQKPATRKSLLMIMILIYTMIRIGRGLPKESLSRRISCNAVPQPTALSASPSRSL